MKRFDNLEKKIRDAFTAAAPENFDLILSRCERQKGKVIAMTDRNKNQDQIQKQKLNQKRSGNRGSLPFRVKLIAAAAVFVLAVAAAALITALAPDMIVPTTATVSLDVNPSVEIIIDCRTEKVLSINALNDDGRNVIGDMDLTGSTLEIAVNALIGSMLRNGYLSEIANSVLISVSSDDTAAAARISETLTDVIADSLNAKISNPAILAQSVNTGNTELAELAESCGITLGKAQLINELIGGSAHYTFDELAGRTINELNLLLEARNIPHEAIAASGFASTEAYIGDSAALAAALADAGVSESEASHIEIEFDFDKGRIVYDVEFHAGGYEYEYEIDALTGKILESEYEPEDGSEGGNPAEPPAATPAPGTEYIGKAEALRIALSHAGIAESGANGIVIELERDGGRMVYEVEFHANGNGYEYKIDALTGKILESEYEPEDRSEGGNPAEPPAATPAPGAEYIGKAEALRIALSHAGIAESGANDIVIELERDGGRMVYEVEFYANGNEYEYKIDALTGKILESEYEPR